MKKKPPHNPPRKAPPSPAPSTHRLSISHSPPLTSRELLLLVAVFIAGIALRLAAFAHSAVEHFDEGVYASNIYFAPPDYAYPLQRFYAPSLLPALIETGFILGLPPNVAALLPSLLAGCGTVLAIWWFGRSWFGPTAGLTAATLAAFNDFHILFSTSALTDELLGVWLILAVDAIARSLLRGDLRWAVGAGIYTGLAWWTKYNGWLPLAIEAAAIPIVLVLVRDQRRRLNLILGCFAVTCIVAVAVWSPYFFSLQSQGGYGPIADNHGRYFVGIAGWLTSASRQVANQQSLESWTSALGVFLAATVVAVLESRDLRQRLMFLSFGIVAAIASYFCTSFLVITAVSFFSLILAATISFGNNDENVRYPPQRAIAFALLAAWWLGLFVTTPCYTPYSRLVLPFTLATYLAAPLCANFFSPSRSQAPAWGLTNPRLRLAALLVTGILALALFAEALLFPRPKLILPRDRCGLFTIAQQIHQTANPNAPRIVYVYGEPGLFFQLRAAGEELIAPVQDIPTTPATVEGQTVPTFFLAGPNTHHDADFQRNWLATQQKWKLVHTYDYHPSPLVWLDLHDPRSKSPSHYDDSVKLYELQLSTGK